MNNLRNKSRREVSIREYDVLVKEEASHSSPMHQICADDWDWLHAQCLSLTEGPSFLRPVYRGGVLGLQARNYVGVVETPSGTRIEILPKIITNAESAGESRRIVLKMLRRVFRLSIYSWKVGALAVLKQPLHEFLIGLFLSEVEMVMKKGLRSQYVQQEDELPFLRGRLRVEQQIHRRPGASPGFAVEYHNFHPNRPENRLIHSAVLACDRWSRNPENQRRARTLRFLFADIPESMNYTLDMQRWSGDRSLIDYRGLKSWCELILTESSPLFMAGKFSGLSFLFPMEQLFERYVEAVLRRKLSSEYCLVAQPRRHSLVSHKDNDWFRLKPDLLIEDRNDKSCAAVLDTKWKQIDEVRGNARDKYGLSQGDFYQMAAYGQKYLGGAGDMLLIYPSSAHFSHHLPPFEFSRDLRLWVVPFDLDTDDIDEPLFFFP